MKSLRIVLENRTKRPIAMDFRIPDDLAEAIQKFSVTNSRFIIMDDKLFSIPDLDKLKQKGTKLNDFTIDKP